MVPAMQSISARATPAENGVRAWAIRVVTAMTIMSALTVAVRVISRRMRRQKLWWDDWLCIVSMIWNFGTLAVILVDIKVNGLGFSQQNLDASQISNLIKLFAVGEIVYACNVTVTKIAVLLLYYRLLRVAFQTSRTLRRFAYAIAAIVIIAAVVYVFMVIFECIPVQKRWQPDLPGHCMVNEIRWILYSSLSILTDVMILTLPVPQIWKMRLGWLEKIGVISIFALGWSVTGISIYRLRILVTLPMTDFSYSILPGVVWSYTEIVIGLTSACLPVSKPAVLWVTHKIGITGREGIFTRLRLIRSSYRGSSNDTAVNTDAMELSIKHIPASPGAIEAPRGSRKGSVGGNSRPCLSEDTLSSATTIIAGDLSFIATDKRLDEIV